MSMRFSLTSRTLRQYSDFIEISPTMAKRYGNAGSSRERSLFISSSLSTVLIKSSFIALFYGVLCRQDTVSAGGMPHRTEEVRMLRHYFKNSDIRYYKAVSCGGVVVRYLLKYHLILASKISGVNKIRDL